MGVADVVLDNPILIKHLRSRLRPLQTLPWLAVVMVLAACTVYAGNSISWFGNPAAVKILLGLQIFILAFGGSNNINTSLGGARESGILDFHRVSPLPPSVVALGFLLGAPIREYVMAASLLPFALFSASLLDLSRVWTGIFWFLQIELAVLTTTWVIHSVAMLGALTRKKPRNSVLMGIGTVIFVLVLLYMGSIGIYLGTQWLMEGDRVLNFFGRMIPWLAWVLLNEVPVLGFLALAVSRKMAAERAHVYTKVQAIACMATLTILMVGGLWKVARFLPQVPPYDWTPADAITITAVYVLSSLAMILAATITPDAGEYIKGVRRAVREGRRRPSPWSDAGSNRIALFALCVLVLAGASLIVSVIGRQPLQDLPFYPPGTPIPDPIVITDAAWLASRQSLTSRPIVVGVLTVAYVGLGLQFFSLRTRRSGTVLLLFFLFLVWLIPMVAGAIIGMSGPDQTRAMTVMALSPIPGLALSTGLSLNNGAEAIRFAALVPPIAFAFVFNSLLSMTQRRIDKQLRAQAKPPDSVAPGIDIDGV